MAYIELGKLKTRAGVSDQEFITAERNIRNGRIQQQPGYLGRELAKNEQGEWLVIIRWESKEDGEAWSPIFMQDPDGGALMGLLDFSAVRQEHFTMVEV